MTRLTVYLDPPMLAAAQAGRYPFLARLADTAHGLGWTVRWAASTVAARLTAPMEPGYALYHMERPTHRRALTFRRAYHFPFWSIEPSPERWRFAVARAAFDPDAIDPARAEDFVARLRARVLPGPAPGRDGPVLVPLQGRIRQTRSFQTMSPVEMLGHVAATGRTVVATLHPRESYDAADRRALAALASAHPNLTIGGDTAALLRRAPFVATMNSSVGFDAMILGKPVVLFAQSDFHHIALNVADLGPGAALARAAGHAPDSARYLTWFLGDRAINAAAPDATGQIRRAFKRGGWPV